MTIVFRATADLLRAARQDLERKHPFAVERVGFLSCRTGRLADGGLVVLACSYHPVEDGDYVDDDSVGAMMGPAAIRKALQRAFNNGAADISVFHIHKHDHSGLPEPSLVDRRESAKFVPDFFNAAPTMPHGIIVLSRNRTVGLCWRRQDSGPTAIARFVSVGAPIEFWRGQ